MTRDYKNVTVTGARRKNKRTGSNSKIKSKSAGEKTIPGWMWLVSGVVIGGFVSFIVYLKLNVPLEGALEVTKNKQVKVEKKGIPENSSSDLVNKKLVSKNSESTSLETDQLEFYKILPNRQVTLPELEGSDSDAKDKHETVKQEPVKTNVRPVQLAPKPTQNSKSVSYIYTLQIGSFLAFKDADKRKANLAMLGIGSRIHAIKTGGKTHYRVLVGPYENIKRVNEIDAAMKANNIKTLLLREKG